MANTSGKTPEERIKELSREICAEGGAHQPSTKQLTEALPSAIVRFLNEKHAADQAAAKAAKEISAAESGLPPGTQQ